MIKKQRHHFGNAGPYSKSCGFFNNHVWMWELDHKEGWAPKNLCFQTVVLEKTLESLLVSREIQLVNPKGNQSWIFIGRTDAEYFGHVMQRANSLEKTLILEKIDGKRRRGSWWQKMRWLDDINDSVHLSLSKLREIVKDREACHAIVHGVAKSWTQLSDWTTPALQADSLPSVPPRKPKGCRVPSYLRHILLK